MNQSRESLINSAVAFLQDPSVSDAPLAKRLAFLESKGLNPSETDEALRRASHLPRSNQVSSYPHQSNELGRDWRDWFIMSVVGGGVGYLAISLVKKFLLPALKPPTQTELDEAQAKLTEKYDEVAKMLSNLQSDTQTIKEDLSQQSQTLDQSIKVVESAVDDCLKSEMRRDEEIRSIEKEVTELKETITVMLEKNKESQSSMILDLQTELKSLKSLLASRPTPTTTSTNSRPLPSTSPISRFNTNRPIGIPAWQLAATTNTTTPSSSHQPMSSASSSTTLTPVPTDLKQDNSLAIVNGSSSSSKPDLLRSDEDEDQILNNGYDLVSSSHSNGGTGHSTWPSQTPGQRQDSA